MTASPPDRDYPSLFETGVSDYFRDFGHRSARERPNQAWLLMSVARHIPARNLVAELQVSRRDLRPFAELGDKNSAVNFDFAVSRSEINLRQWKTQSNDQKGEIETVTQTQKTLQEIAVLAELKMGDSAKTREITEDFKKMAGAIGFLISKNHKQLPRCYFILFDPARKINMDRVVKIASAEWPDTAPFPKILIGPDV